MSIDARKQESVLPAGDARALRIIAKSLYRELRSQGHSRGDIVVFTNALLELVTEDAQVSAEAAE
ncbi:MAG: hypothetical protein GXY23_05080 [Myxococcales bacterium]|nr:hypothetical protein [Myxococcales bacterium]